MNWIEIKNLQTISSQEIPEVDFEILRKEIIDNVKLGLRIVQFFGDKCDKIIKLFVVLADDNKSNLIVSSSVFDKNTEYESLTSEIPSAHFFEREFYEQYGIKPLGHPWLKPLRKGITNIDSKEKNYKFFNSESEEVHEVAVGPIHAGIIEPGHFRFLCHGEDIYSLEIQHGYQTRGIEKLFVKKQNLVHLLKLSESIVGDSVIGHTGTFVRAVESIAGISVSRDAMLVRTIALELERIGIHLGDLAGLATDVAYLTGNSVFSALRTNVINTSLSICGSRFGRGLISLGGVNYNIPAKLKNEILSNLAKLKDSVELAANVMFSSPSVLSRFQKTGVVKTEVAKEIGLVGTAGRASGVSIDIRADHPFGGYKLFPVHKMILNSGDVFARAYIRYLDIIQSIKIIIEQLSAMGNGKLHSEPFSLKPNKFVVSLAEGWRGEIAHVILTGNESRIKRYKIKDPSFNNWYGLDLAVRNNGISDFPVCNKSFNLSYSGMDL